MNRTQKTIISLVAASLALAISACQKSGEPAVTWNGQPSQTAIHSGPVVQGTIRDPSLPDAATVFAAEELAEKARAEAKALELAATLVQPPVTSANDAVIAAPAAEKPAAEQAASAPAIAADKTKLN